MIMSIINTLHSKLLHNLIPIFLSASKKSISTRSEDWASDHEGDHQSTKTGISRKKRKASSETNSKKVSIL